jgi:hypothetical protein
MDGSHHFAPMGRMSASRTLAIAATASSINTSVNECFLRALLGFAVAFSCPRRLVPQGTVLWGEVLNCNPAGDTNSGSRGKTWHGKAAGPELD